MKASIVIRTRDEAPRLRLTLASLERQEGIADIAIADDGSTDDTPAVINAAARRLPIRAIRHAAPLGRSAASNTAAACATGDLLIFLDGDTLAGPDMVARHIAAQHAAPGMIGRGETWHLRCTRFLADPEQGIAWPDAAARIARASGTELAAMRVTRAQIRDDFSAIAARARPGIYPGIAPARLYAEEMRALERGAARSWATASGSNFAIPRALFDAADGFDPALDINEHRELAYRLCRDGRRVIAVPGARTFHLTHREGWRDPLAETGWEQRFRARHPDAPIDALKHYWMAMAGTGPAQDFFA